VNDERIVINSLEEAKAIANALVLYAIGLEQAEVVKGLYYVSTFLNIYSVNEIILNEIHGSALKGSRSVSSNLSQFCGYNRRDIIITLTKL
jgi:hypothetical protein